MRSKLKAAYRYPSEDSYKADLAFYSRISPNKEAQKEYFNYCKRLASSKKIGVIRVGGLKESCLS
jgi:hypothetical protein